MAAPLRSKDPYDATIQKIVQQFDKINESQERKKVQELIKPIVANIELLQNEMNLGILLEEYDFSYGRKALNYAESISKILLDNFSDLLEAKETAILNKNLDNYKRALALHQKPVNESFDTPKVVKYVPFSNLAGSDAERLLNRMPAESIRGSFLVRSIHGFDDYDVPFDAKIISYIDNDGKFQEAVFLLEGTKFRNLKSNETFDSIGHFLAESPEKFKQAVTPNTKFSESPVSALKEQIDKKQEESIPTKDELDKAISNLGELDFYNPAYTEDLPIDQLPDIPTTAADEQSDIPTTTADNQSDSEDNLDKQD